MIDGWTPEIGDPTVYGWLAVLAYAVAAWLCWRAAWAGPRRERPVWLTLCGILAFLCINKQLDLQSLVLTVAKTMVKAQGWYASRHKYQQAFIAALVMVGIVVTLGLMRASRRARWPLWGAVGGMAVLQLFILLRASTIEKVGQFTDRVMAGMPVNDVLEMGGIVIIAFCAAMANLAERRR